MINLSGVPTLTQTEAQEASAAAIVAYDAATGLEAANNLQTSGMSTAGRAVTAVLRVSPNGDDSDGLTWGTAYTTIQGALAAASTDVNECTLILVGINTGSNYYDIDMTGNPTFTGNYIVQGSHRTWTKIKNNHAGATSLLKFTGYTSLIDLNFNLGTGNNGVSIRKGAARVSHCQFVGEDLTSAKTALSLNHASLAKHAKVTDCNFRGKNGTLMTALLLDKYCCSNFTGLRMHDCLKGIQITGATSDENAFNDIDIGECAIALDLDEGNEQHFNGIIFHHNTVNIDDEVGDHIFTNIHGEFPISTEPDNFTGVDVDTGDGANVWTAAPVQVRGAASVPFRITGVHVEADASEKFRIKLTDGTTTFMDIQIEGENLAHKRTGVSAPSGTEFIFNQGAVISAYSKSESAGVDTATVWLELQEI